MVQKQPATVRSACQLRVASRCLKPDPDPEPDGLQMFAMPMLHPIVQRLFAILLLWLCGLALANAAEPVSLRGGVPIGGKDTVAYHDRANRDAHQATDGRPAFTVQYLGQAWRFASQASADRFAAEPGLYVPQYSGHCANALAIDEGLITTDGTVWEFFGDRLYLFYAERGRQRWLKGDWQAFRKDADAAWKNILQSRLKPRP